MTEDPEIQRIAFSVLGIISGLVGMFIGAFWGLGKIVDKVIEAKFGWMQDWKARIDEERAMHRADLDGLYNRMRRVETDVAVLLDRDRK